MVRKLLPLLIAVSVAQAAGACPAMLFQVETVPRLKGARRGARVFAKEPSGAALRPIPFQVDPVDADGHLVFFPDNKYLDRPLDDSDVFTFRTQDFGPKVDFKREKLPCRGAYVFELQDPASQRYAYLTNCGAGAAALAFAPIVEFQPAKDFLESPVYRYRFNPENYMQFESISFRSAAQGTWETIAERSALMIRADVKNFFTMHFDAKEIESHLESHRVGPIGNLARLSFFLRILFFKIKMSLSTDVGFYEDSSHIPMMVNIPVDAFQYLNPASGILYTWILSPSAQTAPRRLQMPTLDPAFVKKGWKELAKEGLKYCVKDSCAYKYTVEISGKTLSMDLGLDRKLVERGFFPIYVEDARREKEAMGWDFELAKDEVRTGMYFEVSGLPSGGHPWDFWLRLGGASKASATCPAPLRFQEVKVL